MDLRDDIEIIEEGFLDLCGVLDIDPEFFCGDQTAPCNIAAGLKQMAKMLKPMYFEFDKEKQALNPTSPVGLELLDDDNNEQKLVRLRTIAMATRMTAERSMYEYACACDVGEERARAFEVYERIRTVTRIS